MVGHDRPGVLAPEGVSTGDRAEQQHSDRVDVCPVIEEGAGDLLGRHEALRATAERLGVGVVKRDAAAKVGDLQVASQVEQQVLRLEIAMHDPLLVQEQQQIVGGRRRSGGGCGGPRCF